MTTQTVKRKQGYQRSGVNNTAKMYDVLAAMSPGWHDRQAIASAMGKPKLNTSDLAALNALSTGPDGTLESRIIDVTLYARRIEYRVKPGATE